MKKIIGKLAIYLVIGAVFGFLFATFFMNWDNSFDFDFTIFAAPFIVVLLVLVASLVVFSLSVYFRIKTYIGQTFEGDEEDEMEGKMYRISSDGNLATTLAVILSLAGMATTLLTEVWIYAVLVFAVLLLSATIVSFMLASLMGKMYPDRKLPLVSDKDYSKKLLAVSDDGERHVMLGGLFKSYQSMNTLLFLGILFLLFYSLATGSTQMAGILVITVVLIIVNAQYALNVRNK